VDDLVAIDQLLRRYGDIATRRAWDEFGEIILPDAPMQFVRSTGDPLEFTGPDAVADLGKQAMADFDFYLYVPLNSVATVAGDGTATGRVYSHEVATTSAGEMVHVYGRYDDRYVKDDGRWMIAARRYETLLRR
jgi:hypothetical protein